MKKPDVTYHLTFVDQDLKIMIRKYLPKKGHAPVAYIEHELESRERFEELKVLFESIKERGADW